MSRYRIGVDIGGTFTDFSAFDSESGRLIGWKSPTVPADPVAGLVEGLAGLARVHGVQPDAVAYFVHGTTIAVNTLIERKGARLALFVTAGFRDLLIIQRLHVPRPQYWYGNRPAPLIPRERVFEIDERLGADGGVRTPLSEESVLRAVAAAQSAGVDGIVICFLHAYNNPAHEKAARAMVERVAPGLFVCCSAETWPRMREYERAIISIVNAYVMPPVAGYLGRLDERMTVAGMTAKPYITRSNGGVMSARSARLVPAETLLSGPASGVIGAVAVAASSGERNLVTLDIGGTSADVAFVEDGRAQVSQSEHVAAFPIMMPVIGVSSIGAGGGSVIWLDEAGVLKIGPESAGSDPGPACYGRGSTRPALTDAFLAGGFINPGTFAGGRVRLDPARAAAALVPVASRLGADLPATVEGILAVASATLHAELSNLAAQRGVDVRDYTLVGFGGAGPLLACRLAGELGMTRVLVPLAPGTLCALGALSADVASGFVQSLLRPLAGAAEALAGAYDDLLSRARAWLAAEAPPDSTAHRITLSADMRYAGQSYEIDVALEPDWVLAGAIDQVTAAFHAMHRRVYSHADPTMAVEIVDLRLGIHGTMPKPAPPELARGSGPAPAGSHRSVLVGHALVPVPVWARATLKAGQTITGPGLVDQDDTTCFVPPGWTGLVHANGNLLLERAR